jgi:deoxyadenosine/deoxycytidine kinase
MGKIVSVVGNLGSGKTTLTRLICDKGLFLPFWEIPEEHPFHVEFGKDMQRWALANQIDFFLFRCKQEAIARRSNNISVFDGGFDQDFHVFTQHIFNKGYLNQDEFDVCSRFYDFARAFLPPPDLIIRIIVDLPTLLQRRLTRARKTDDHVFNKQELSDFEILLDDWLGCKVSLPIVKFSFNQDFNACSNEIQELIALIKTTLLG